MTHGERPKAVVLLSGGLDSTTCLAIAKDAGYACYALTFSYGQRHKVELEAARRVAAAFSVEEHLVLELPLDRIGGSALTSPMEVPKDAPLAMEGGSIPVTYVPARNTIFLSLALAWAEVLGAADIFIGVNAVDYSGYPDCRPEYIEAFQHMANLATKAGVEGQMKVRIRTPLLHWSKAQIVRKGRELGVDYDLTHSCYDPDPEGRPCGRCESCRLRARGLEGAQELVRERTGCSLLVRTEGWDYHASPFSRPGL
ncbi:preQ(0) biosynthesis protein QueC [Desulfacinum hydrothermale DSM 13146]|uniref:7-cyano-7-deazaguanine synthase n=1 Tax=Desulfacinum hydrothermale DSM 13146 TaxID=1121390 RepID=A0A1W1XKC3_9BACT|nr:7-cyano-7-deazaguanine synthase QueC [Desulfacinum hydrothermale]SMC24430.1 preQ(0) biosynthesis protein QueC [Desulfacinum hydrothermale DSM 13146]